MHLLHSNYFSAPDFSQLSSPPSYNGMKHSSGVGDMPGDGYHQLTHESRSSSLGDCHAATPTSLGAITNQQQQPSQDNFGMSGDRRGSIFDSQNSMPAGGYANTPAGAPISLPHHSEGFVSPHVTTYDFTRHRDSSISYSGSDGSQTPATSYSGGSGPRRESSNLSDSLSSAAASISFQFPSLASNRTNPLSSFVSTSQDSNLSGVVGGDSSSDSLPLREYLLTSQATTASLVAEGMTAAPLCKTSTTSTLGGGTKGG